MKVLLLGSDGQLGSTMREAWAGSGLDLVAAGRAEADLAEPGAAAALVARHRPDVVVNAAAYTAVDAAETDAGTAARINRDAVAELAAAIGEGWLIHYSTDYVFDGTKSAPYDESDAPRPLNVYGRTKHEGEAAIAAAGIRHLILRTSWVHAPRRRNFATTILRLAAQRDRLDVVADQVGAPTGTALIAHATRTLLERIAAGTPPASGVYHCSAAGACSWHEYARFVVTTAAAAGAELRLTPDAITAVSSTDYKQAAARPGNSRLDTAKLEAVLGAPMPDWRLDVERTVRDSLPEPAR